MNIHSEHYEQARAVPQIEPLGVQESWHDVKEYLPSITWNGESGQSKTVLIWCLKRRRVFGADLHFEDGAVYWFARSIEGNFTEIQHHISQVTHWRPVPLPPPEYQ